MPVAPKAYVTGRILVQGKLTDAAGTALNGNYTFVFSLYTVAAGGVAACSDTQTLAVSGGLFSTSIAGTCTSYVVYGQQLFLGIKVGTDAEMTPRQAIYPQLYARTLIPGAYIAANNTHPAYGFQVGNLGTGRGIGTTTLSGAGVIGQNTGESPTEAAVYGVSTHSDGVMGKTLSLDASGVVGVQPGYEPADNYLSPPGGFFGGANGVVGLTKLSNMLGVIGISKAATTAYGVYGLVTGTSGAAVYGYANVSTGTAFGVLGQTRSPDGYGVVGVMSGYATSDKPASYWDSGGLFGGRNGLRGLLLRQLCQDRHRGDHRADQGCRLALAHRHGEHRGLVRGCRQRYAG